MPTLLIGPVTGCPSMVSVPSDVGFKPLMSFIIELLPQPDGPTTAMNSPLLIVSVRLSTALTAFAPCP